MATLEAPSQLSISSGAGPKRALSVRRKEARTKEIAEIGMTGGGSAVGGEDVQFFETFNNIDANAIAQIQGTDTNEVPEEDIDITQKELPHLVSFPPEDQPRLLRLAVRTIVDWVGGVTSEEHNAEHMLKYLCDAFVFSTNWDARITVDQFAEILLEEQQQAKTRDRAKTKYTVKLIQGRNMESKDVNGLSDPYCYVGIIPVQAENIKDYPEDIFKRSKIVKKTLNPVFNEEFDFVINDPTSAKLLVDFWDWDENGWANKLSRSANNDDFLGRLSVPLGNLESDFHEVLELQKRSKKSTVSGDFEIQIKAQLYREGSRGVLSRSEAMDGYRDLDALFVLHEDGVLSSMSEALLRQFRLQNNIGDNIAMPVRYVHLVQRLMVKPINTKNIADTLAAVHKIKPDTLDKTLQDELVQTFNTSIKRFEYTIWRFQITYPFGNKSANDMLFDLCDVMSITFGLPLYKATHPEGPDDLANLIKANLVENAQRTYNRGMAEARLKDGDGVSRLTHLLAYLLGNLNRAKADPPEALVSLGISYVNVHLNAYLPRLATDFKDTMESVTAGGDPHPAIFGLYFLLQTFSQTYLKRLPKELVEDSGLDHYHDFFTPHVIDWMRASRERTEHWIHRAIQVDKDSKPIDGQMYSSSVVDVFSSFSQTLAFLEKLAWPDPMIHSVFTTMFVQMICEGVTTYTEVMREEFQRKAATLSNDETTPVGTDAQSFVTQEQCIHLNNLEVTHQKMNSLYEALDLPGIVQQLRSVHGSDFEPPINTLFNEQYEFVKERLDFCLDYLADQPGDLLKVVQMAPIIMTYLTEMVGYQDPSAPVNILLVNKNQKVMAGDPSEKIDAEEVDVLMAPLVEYLDINLEVLGGYLYHEVFQSMLHRIWIRIVSNFNTILSPALNVMTLAVSPRQASCIAIALENLRNYLYAGGDGIKPAKLDSTDYKELKRRLDMVFEPTDKLITMFYDVEAATQSDIHELADESIHPANEIEELDLGSMEAELCYLPDKDTLTVFLVEAKGLPAFDDNGKSDPYVVMTLITANMQSVTRKSRVCYETLHPVFHQTFEFKLNGRPLSDTTLQFSFYDHDFIGGDDYMGEVLVKLNTLQPNESLRNTWRLKRLSAANAALVAKYGTMDATLTLHPAQRKLDVEVHNCRNLPAMDTNGFSDPYVKVRLLPYELAKTEPKRTRTIMNTLNPDFNEKLTLFVKAAPDKLMVQLLVFDYDMLAKDDYIGEVLVRLVTLPADQPVHRVYNLLRSSADSDSKFIFCILNARPGDEGAKAFCLERAGMFMEA